MCWNFSNGEISVTDYAKRLGIDEVLYRQVFLSIFDAFNAYMLLY